jgi:hypothetical protein
MFFNLLCKEIVRRVLHFHHSDIICRCNLVENARLAIDRSKGPESLVKGFTLFWNWSVYQELIY